MTHRNEELSHEVNVMDNKCWIPTGEEKLQTYPTKEQKWLENGVRIT